MQALDRQNIAYNFIDAGQHAGITGELIQQFGLRQPDIRLRQEQTSITTLIQAIIWTLKSMLQLIFKRRQILETVFRGHKGICLIHGDTLTTLLSLFYAKRCGLKVAHVEAGLRSYHLLNPFPEEIIRLMAMRFSDVLFAPSDWAMDNLGRMGYSNKVVDAEGNTGLDAVRFALQTSKGQYRPQQPYVVVTTHRVETIYSRSRLGMVVALVEQIAQDYQVLFVLHEPTERQLHRFDLYNRITALEAIKMLPLQSYLTFVDLLAGADFIMTDGGSIQEESYFLNVPCLIIRSKTERTEGLNENAYLAEFDQVQIDRFFQLLPTLRRGEISETLSPSSIIVENILPWA